MTNRRISVLLLVGGTLGFFLTACIPPGAGGNVQIPGGDSLSSQQAVGMLEDAAIEFHELSKPNTVRAWVDNLIVKSQPGDDMPEVARMKEGEEATYMYQRTIRKAKYKLRDQYYNESWLLIQTRDSIAGWVHGGGVVFVQPDFTELFSEQQEDQPSIVGTDAGEELVRNIDDMLSPEAAPAQPSPEQLKQLEKIDYRVIPGKRVGPIKLKTSEADLINMYGPGVVSQGTVKTPPSKVENCTVLMAGLSDELRITWKDEGHTRVKAIYMDKAEGKWHSKEGIKVGTPMLDLTKINNAPISFYGFNWDYSGTVSDYGKGKLASKSKHFYLQLAPHSTFGLLSALVDFEGDQVFTSNTEGVDKLNLVVKRLVVYLD